MFQEQPDFQQIDNKAILWRYQDLPRYLDLLLKQQLFFCRADRFEDPFEGKYPLVNKEQMVEDEILKQNDVIGMIQRRKNAENAVDQFVKDSADKRTFVTINSWHYNDTENYAMWKIYARGTYGLAIQTTYERLKRCFEVTDKQILIGKVNYYDEQLECIPMSNALQPFLSKRKIYEYESEVRCCYILAKEEEALTWQEQGSENGIFINVDLNTLIDKIYISPYSPKWIVDIVQGINEKFGIHKEIMHSTVFDGTEY